MKTLIITILLCLAGSSVAGDLYVDIKTGSDTNPGSSDLPFKTIQKAVDVLNTADTPAAIKIAPGLYSLDKECSINSKAGYSSDNPLTIEAAILPDDPNWKPNDMPIIVSTLNPVVPENAKYIETSGFKVEMDHVKIRGLKFIGTPIPGVMYYPVYRLGKSLDDLVVTQCMFLCSQYVTSSNVAIIVHGHGLQIDHCVFYDCANAVVFWNADGGISKNNSMTHCIIDGGYVSGVWLCQTGEDFEFHHNIITRCQYAFMRNDDNKKTYKIRDCIINNFEFFSGFSGPNFELSESGADMPYIEQNITKSGEIKLVKGAGLDMGIPQQYLQVEEGTPGSDLGAGLFIK